MDRKQIDDEHIVARYLADQLTPAEAEAFEAYYTQHPRMVREIEYALRLKEKASPPCAIASNSTVSCRARAQAGPCR